MQPRNNTSPNQTGWLIKRITHHDQGGFTHGMQGWLNTGRSTSVAHHIDITKDKNYVSSHLMTWQNLMPFPDENNKPGIEGNFSTWQKAIHEKPTANINGERLKVSLLKSRTRQGCPHFPLQLKKYWESSPEQLGKKEKLKGIHIGKEVKFCLQVMW